MIHPYRQTDTKWSQYHAIVHRAVKTRKHSESTYMSYINCTQSQTHSPGIFHDCNGLLDPQSASWPERTGSSSQRPLAEWSLGRLCPSPKKFVDLFQIKMRDFMHFYCKKLSKQSISFLILASLSLGPVNVPSELEVRSLNRSWDNRGVPKNCTGQSRSS